MDLYTNSCTSLCWISIFKVCLNFLFHNLFLKYLQSLLLCHLPCVGDWGSDDGSMVDPEAIFEKWWDFEDSDVLKRGKMKRHTPRGQWRVDTTSVPDSLRSCHWPRHQSLCNTGGGGSGGRTHTHTHRVRDQVMRTIKTLTKMSPYERDLEPEELCRHRGEREAACPRVPFTHWVCYQDPSAVPLTDASLADCGSKRNPRGIKHSTYLKPSALSWLRIYINSPARRELWFSQVDTYNYFVF